MNNLSPFSADIPQGEQQVAAHFTQQSQSNTSSQGLARILQVWYGITSPPEPGASAPFEERELFRRGRTGSQVSIFLFILLFISYPAAFAGSNSLLIAILTADLFVMIFAMGLNHMKRVNIAGILVVLCFTASPTVNILTTPGGVNTSSLTVFGLLVLPLMCAVSFLPPWWVFVVAAANSIFSFYVLTFMPTSGELHEVLKVAFPGIFTPILLSQGIVSIVGFLWVRGATQALLRADQAEEIAEYERREGERQQHEIEQKKELDYGIEQILGSLNKVANGELNVKVPLDQNNILWRVGYSINNLLARIQAFKEERLELARTRQVAAAFTEALKLGQFPNFNGWTHTCLDGLLIELRKISNWQQLQTTSASSPRQEDRDKLSHF